MKHPSRPPAARSLAALFALMLIGGASGCTGIFSGSGDAPRLYTLTAPERFSGELPAVASQLVVEVPIASQGLDTTHIAAQQSARALNYYAGGRWIEPAPRMVQTVLVESFENTGKIVSVARRGSDLKPDFSLRTELRAFAAEIHDPDEAPLIHVKLTAKLIDMGRQIIVGSKTAEHAVRAQGPSLPNVVEAFDEALAACVGQIVDWTVREMG